MLRPLDAVAPYRLEMQARLCTPRGKNLYEFWGARLARQVLEGESLLIDLSLIHIYKNMNGLCWNMTIPAR